jgi:hypothetical protein
MTVPLPARAAFPVAIAIAAPILSSACANDLAYGGREHLEAGPVRTDRPGSVPRYAPPYRMRPRHARPSASPPGPNAFARRRGPTYVEAVFEVRKSAVGPPFRERFHGFATVGPNGRANIEIRNVARTVRCSGRSRVTGPPTGPGAVGLTGEAFISCSDGRYAIADYRYVTDTRGEGEGRDYLGNRFTIRFMVVP